MRSTRALPFVTALLGAAGAWIAWRRYRPFPVRVSGASMEPGLKHGNLLVVSARLAPRPGDVVVLRTRGVEMVKRVTSVNDGYATFEGDNRNVSMSFVEPVEHVAGVVLLRYWPKPRVLRRR